MKPYDKDIDIVFSPMSDETMSWLDELLTTCKRFGVDYYNASEKDRAFVEAVARKNYGIKQAKTVPNIFLKVARPQSRAVCRSALTRGTMVRKDTSQK